MARTHDRTRRAFLKSALTGAAGAALSPLALPARLWAQEVGAPAIGRVRPLTPGGVAVGDPMADRAILWSRTDRPARMIIDWATNHELRGARRVLGPTALADTDYTARIDLAGLPPGEDIYYRVVFESLEDRRAESAPLEGRFRTAPLTRKPVRFVWSGDAAGQGWGINAEWGGMKLYDCMLAREPDFFLCSGDAVYSDGPISAEVALPGGGTWRNLVTPEKSKVAETLQEFRGQYHYNQLDEPFRRFMAAVPAIYQWDDHETLNNWYPLKALSADERYTTRSVELLAARARRAFMEQVPMRLDALDRERIYRRLAYGPALDLFVLDMRSYRGSNGANLQETAGPDTAFLGADQMRWLKRELLASTATWKVIAADMPIGLVVGSTRDGFEAVANADDGPARGRELELADLLRFVRDSDIRNLVWLTADVHYAAAHHFDPIRARSQEFLPFWEFVAGPIHAGGFGPQPLDMTFGPEVVFARTPPAPNPAPSEGYLSFGEVEIDPETEQMTVTLRGLEPEPLYAVKLIPA